MNDSRTGDAVAAKPTDAPTATPAAPMFRRYQIAVKAGIRVGAVPTGRPPIGF